MVNLIAGSAVFRSVLRWNLRPTASGWWQQQQHRQAHEQDAAKRRFVCFRLSHRALLRVQGQDTAAFLQGLITNDMNALGRAGTRSLYAHMLNVQGRTMFDIIIYSLTKTQDEELAILLECDSTVTDSIQKHLKVYKIRRKVNISPCTDLALWAVLPSPSGQDAGAVSPELLSPTAAVVWDEDPRTKAMGWRLVTDKNISPMELIACCQQGETEEYHWHRYTIGLPESVSDLPPGVMLPLEANLVYMQGISFSKGCYLGQELTARTHHTGVIRKRLMPVCLSAPPDQGPPQGGMPLVTRAGKPAGKHLCTLGDRGLSLVRLDYAKEPLVLQNPGGTAVTVEASVPDWWPADSKGS
ncbi:putative transferase CAF17 homolog, mitochondrial [Scleropages formosus]|uniref:Iron-sulfur cluster assembly factor IBA57, mitochondrial n=1 Tax=Scleropages formosus TaxID=113540 RepID=A0A8C9TPE1_SCLFO|nr:putative transferase CAF17, mitochondrial [Scleropages formosus]